jgi:futalosine hydrolase
MNILIVSATSFEVYPLSNVLNISDPSIGLHQSHSNIFNKNIDILITGVGMVNTAIMLSKNLHRSYDLIINVGVCGAFTSELTLGQVVNVTEDILSEMGAENGDNFIKFDELGLPGEYKFFNKINFQNNLLDSLNKVKGITVNTILGNENSIEKTSNLFQPNVESMEGAAFFAACNGLNLNYIQIRAISNYVEKRDKSKWQIPLAITNLNGYLISFIKSL